VWECVVRWIDHDAEKRKIHLTKLMRAVRMGLLSNAVSFLFKRQFYNISFKNLFQVFHGKSQAQQIR
jgi:hypothetical protein